MLAMISNDYLTLMLVNMSAGLFLLACFVYRGLDSPEPTRWVPGFLVAGFVATVTGLHMSLTWPLPETVGQMTIGMFNSAFGEMSVLLGVLFLGAAVALWKGWDLLTLGVYAFFAGLAAVILGLRIIEQALTMKPVLSGLGFILSGLGGVLALPAMWLRRVEAVRVVGAIVLVVASAIWALTGYVAYWHHIAKG